MEKPRKGLNTGRVPVYDQSFKIAVVKEYLSGEYSLAQVGKKHNLTRDTVHHFVQWYKTYYPEPKPVEVTAVLPSETRPKRTVEELEQELAYANLKITAFEILISNAEREMGVDIRKKAGSKPSTK
jgi:transposase-like protein